MSMKLRNIWAPIALVAMALSACQRSDTATTAASAESTADGKNAVIETIMSRRSIRDYQERAVPRDTMALIAECGINAPNAMNKQEWEIRIVDNPEFINGVTRLFVKENPKMAEDPKFRNMFRNAPTVVFIAAPDNGYSGVNCGLLGENMILAAWSMGIGSCCLGGPVAFMKSQPAADYLAQLNFSEGYTLLYAIGFGFPAETPEAKPRDKAKIQFVD